MDQSADAAGRILDGALALGERCGWDALQLHELAATLGIRLADIHRHYRQKDDLAEAWFDRADLAMMRTAESPAWRSLPVRERLSRTILAWLQVLAAYRPLAIGMLRYKLQPDHLHLQAGVLLRISRTVQWIRETACLPSVGLRRELEEAALTAIFVSTVVCWITDASADMHRTRRWLDKQLLRAERLALRFAR